MLRLASPLRLSAAIAALGLATLAAARPAAASDPMTTYVVPTIVDLEPSDDAATRVVIHGAFFQLTSDTNFSYSDPKCGVMYFQCAAGQEAMCRMQWKEIRAAISPTRVTCSGFGSLHVLSKAAIRVEGAPLGAPDTWDLGMGIGTGSHVDGKCPVALKLACPLSATDAGAPAQDAGPAATGAAGTSVAPTTGAAGTSGAAGTGAAGTGAAGTTGAAGATGVAGTSGAAGTEGKPLAKSGGCTLAGGATSGALTLLALASLVVVARRRRR
jgi:hypothetical protein